MDPLPTRLLGFLRARPRPVGRDFRANPRHESDARARIAWNQGLRSRAVRADFIDIGRLGAALRTADPPPQGALIRVRLVGEHPTPWIEAEVLAVEPLDEGQHRVRLKFLESCPTVLLKAAVFGSTASEAAPVSSSPTCPID